MAASMGFGAQVRIEGILNCGGAGVKTGRQNDGRPGDSLRREGPGAVDGTQVWGTGLAGSGGNRERPPTTVMAGRYSANARHALERLASGAGHGVEESIRPLSLATRRSSFALTTATALRTSADTRLTPA